MSTRTHGVQVLLAEDPCGEDGRPLSGELVAAYKKESVMTALRGFFRPEFINRVDEFILFDPLTQEQIRQIVKLQVNAARA